MKKSKKETLGPPHWEGDHPVVMKRPLAALLMDNGFREDVLEGNKLITIREGWRDYREGEKVVLCYINSDAGWATMGQTTEVTHCKLKDVPLTALKDDGMESLEHAVECLSDFYPNISGESLVTIIRWKLI